MGTLIIQRDFLQEHEDGEVFVAIEEGTEVEVIENDGHSLLVSVDWPLGPVQWYVPRSYF